MNRKNFRDPSFYVHSQFFLLNFPRLFIHHFLFFFYQRYTSAFFYFLENFSSIIYAFHFSKSDLLKQLFFFKLFRRIHIQSRNFVSKFQKFPRIGLNNHLFVFSIIHDLELNWLKLNFQEGVQHVYPSKANIE